MLNINKVSNSLVVEGLNNKFYPNDGRLSVPLNSIILVLDESDIVTFRSSANNNVYFSGKINQIRISGETVNKNNIVSKFDAVANSSGGGSGDYDELERKLNAEITNRVNGDETLAGLINDEKQARINGDSNLQTQITGVTDNAISATVTGTTLKLDNLS